MINPNPLQLLIILLWLRSSACCAQQYYYDPTPCSSNTTTPATSYTCAAVGNSCQTFVVYRANRRFSTISAVSNLFQTNSRALLSLNHNVSSPTQILELGHEILVPIACSCSADRLYRSNFTHKPTQNISISEIACAMYEGLVKSAALAAANSFSVSGDGGVTAGTALRVPVKCACLDDVSHKNETRYLITYPLIEGDSTAKVGAKFNVAVEQIWKFNHMEPYAPTVFPNTTVLVPVRETPFINFSIPDSDPPTPPFLATKPVGKWRKWSELKKLYVAGSAVGTCLIIALIISCFLYIKALKKFKDQRILALNSCSTPISSLLSTNSCLSPDLLVGIKYSLCSYTIEELKIATKNFSEDVRMSSSIYRGDEVMIKEMTLIEQTKQMIEVHSKINHVNIVKLQGVCYSDSEADCSSSCSYLVFELPCNGSLRDCLLMSSSAALLHWQRRTQIAFDVATGLHYLYNSVTPAYTGLSLSSTTIFLSSSWRAKILVCGESATSSPLGVWIAPEYDVGRGGAGDERVEIFGFGVLLLELIAGREGLDERGVRETMTFLGGGALNEGGCFEQLRKFVDPCLKDDYPLAEALCLAVLAGSCVEDDPKHRPSMEDVLKILARMV